VVLLLAIQLAVFLAPMTLGVAGIVPGEAERRAPIAERRTPSPGLFVTPEAP
jgi:hypothetical protein